jgi:hypothetical protein
MLGPAADRLFDAKLKIERANRHISEVECALNAFYDLKPYKVRTKRDPQTRRLIYYVASIEETPRHLLLAAGDAIQNLRSALDHLAFQLFLAGVGGKERDVQFPISADATAYKNAVPRRLPGVRQDALDLLDAVEPYKGGKGHQLWVLQELNNADKHRLLLTAGSAFQSLDLGSYMYAKLSAQLPDWWPVETPFPSVPAFYKPSDRMCPLKAGDELFHDEPNAGEVKEMRFRFNVALNEKGIAEAEPLLETLRHLASVVEGVIGRFAALL